MRFRSVVMTGVVTIGLSIATVPTAFPASGSTTAETPSVKSATTPMTLQRQVSAVAHGTDMVITLDNGARFTMPAAEYQSAQQRVRARGVAPQNTVFGNCGYSYTYLYNWGNRTYRLAVGFHVDAPAIDYSWGAYVNGAGRHYYEYHYTAGGGLAWRSDWAGGHTGTVPAADYYDADTYYGAAELWYGSWCFAGYTNDATHVS